MKKTMNQQQESRWVRVSFAADCPPDPSYPLEPGDYCSVCGGYYPECPCPGPTMDDEYEYAEIDGVLMARKRTSQ